jgi:hypothetical protein
MSDVQDERRSADKFVVFDEYRDAYNTAATLKGAKYCAEDNIKEMYRDGGGDSGCEQIIYERKGIVIGSMKVDIEEIWDEKETVDTVELNRSVSGEVV